MMDMEHDYCYLLVVVVTFDMNMTSEQMLVGRALSNEAYSVIFRVYPKNWRSLEMLGAEEGKRERKNFIPFHHYSVLRSTISFLFSSAI